VFAELEKQGVCIFEMDTLNDESREALRTYFYEEVFPVLTPLGVDHARPFPFISNLSLNLAVTLRRPNGGESEFVRLKVPDVLPRLVNLDEVLKKYANSRARDSFVWLEDVISANLDLLFPGMKVIDHHPFRVTRNADIDYEHEKEDNELDMSQLIEASLR